MHEERKKWMLSEMAARIPYGVQVQYNQKDYNVVGIYKGKLLLEDSEGKSEQAEVTEIYTHFIDKVHIREKSDRDTLVKSVLGSKNMTPQLKSYLWQEFSKNNLPKYYKYFEQWVANLTDNQVSYFIAYMLNLKTCINK